MAEANRQRRSRQMSGEAGEARRKGRGPERPGMEREGFEERQGKAYRHEPGDR